MKLPFQITSPFVSLDSETTGTNIAKDRIVSLTFLKFFPDGRKELKKLLLNPTIPIPKEASDVHGITDEMVKDCPTFKEVAQEVFNYVDGCDLMAYNAMFDIPLLAEEFERSGLSIEFPGDAKIVDPMVIFKSREQRNLTAALKFYCGEELEGAHDSTADTIAATKVLIAQCDYYDDLSGGTLESLAAESEGELKRVDFAGKMVFNKDGKVIFNFGKYYGRLLHEVFKEDPNYYTGFLAKSTDFTSDTKKKFKKYYELVYPAKK